MPEYRVLRIDEQLYGCEELPAGQPVLCDVTLTDAAGAARILPYPDRELTCLGIDEGDLHLQQHQQRTAHTNENHRQHSSCSPGQRQHPGRGAAHALFITCAKQAADRQRQTVIHAEGEVHDKAVQGSCSPDFRQGSVPQDMPGQSGIRQIIELLQQVA